MRWPWRAPRIATLALVVAAGCRSGGGANEGVVVRQVLHGTDVLRDGPAESPRRGAAAGQAAPIPGMVATTLVSDMPQAIYKQAGDAARRQLESQSVRAALSRLDAHMDQEQESAE